MGGGGAMGLIVVLEVEALAGCTLFAGGRADMVAGATLYEVRPFAVTGPMA